MRRFAKIAKALGNRTPRQVASRLQKYFQKLHAAGLPVPGRIPRNARNYASTRKNRMIKHMVRPTTFFPSNYVPVNITEDEDNVNSLDPNYYRSGCNPNYMNEEDDNMVIVDEPSDNESDGVTSDKTIIASIIKRVQRDKEREQSMELPCEHIGFKVIFIYRTESEMVFFKFLHFSQCDCCEENPISGTRWHCVTCKDLSIDYCSDCFVTQAMGHSHHEFDHTFIGYRVVTDFQADSDADSDGSEDDTNKDDSQCNESDDINCGDTSDTELNIK